MMVVGLLQLDLHLPMAASLKDKRSVLKSVKDQLRGRFNVAVAEFDANDKWQRAFLGVATVGCDRQSVDDCLRRVTDCVRDHRLVSLVHIEQEVTHV